MNKKLSSTFTTIGVLAAIGLLSIGGIAGYTKISMRYKINKTIEQVAQIVKKARAGQINYYSADIQQTSPFGGEIWLEFLEKNLDDNSLSKKGFAINLNGLPKEACVALATYQWEAAENEIVPPAIPLDVAQEACHDTDNSLSLKYY